MGPLHTRHGFAVPPSPSRRGPFSFSQGARRAGADLCPILPRNCIGLYWTVLNCIVLYWLDLLRLLDLLGLLSLTISAGMDSRIKASIIPAWFILISLKVDFYQLYYTVKVQKSQLRRQTKIRVFCSDEWSGLPYAVGEAPTMWASAPTRWERRSCLLPRLNVLGVPSTPVRASPCHPLQAGEGEKPPAAFFCSRGEHLPLFFPIL